MLKRRHRIAQRLYLAASRFTRGMTLGVRAMLVREGSVLLVKHSYLPGWYFPGGGVEAGESAGEALSRELMEEAGVTLTGPAALFGVYRHPAPPQRDHVVFYVCREWRREVERPRSREIVAAELFPLADLPVDAAPSTLARAREVISGVTPSSDW